MSWDEMNIVWKTQKKKQKAKLRTKTKNKWWWWRWRWKMDDFVYITIQSNSIQSKVAQRTHRQNEQLSGTWADSNSISRPIQASLRRPDDTEMMADSSPFWTGHGTTNDSEMVVICDQKSSSERSISLSLVLNIILHVSRSFYHVLESKRTF